MKLSNSKTNSIILVGILLLLLINLFSKRTAIEKPKITIVRDTIWQPKIDTFKVQTIKYKKVYVHKKDITKIIKDTIFIKDTINFITAKIYRDTLNNADLEIYSYDLVKGKLLDSQLSYKLKVPREITITKTIEHPKTYRSGLYLFSEVGGNTQRFDNLSLGLQYNRKGRWFASYRLNVNPLSQPTHNIGFGYRLFN
ncbi:hypothetical protein SAMN04487765_1126 [Tenacibaculum sp. MAR_2010_89]|uniref:hypothetical protein n=1 Tax=Tenacibaculum sp. MAR_2010_89 TaxID=1250198 RepID=UPI000897988D|nr:hypothetical protein [Tenacibaculum sp. MAR_2010_89]SEE02018.1 hypothetical protein SAMN04487765_1126 [Tenacibaculum sp. MAR_2010_89]